MKWIPWEKTWFGISLGGNAAGWVVAIRKYAAAFLCFLAIALKKLWVLFFWDLRHTPFPWALMLLAGGGLAWSLPNLLSFAYDQKTFPFTNIWPLVTALSAAPVAWYLFFIRDRNKQTDQRIENRRIVTDRYARAIDHLGAKDEKGQPNLEIRLGGIYSLEQVALQSDEDHWPIMEILCAYVRENSPWKPIFPKELKSQVERDIATQYNIDLDKLESEYSDLVANPKLPRLDIQAIMNVLNRRKTEGRENLYGNVLDLSRTNLQGVELGDTNLEHAIFAYSSLRGAKLFRANCSFSNFSNADLFGIYLRNANLKNTRLNHTNLKKAILRDSNLENTDLSQSKLWDANMWGAVLVSADLHFSDLRRVDLNGADLQGAYLYKSNLREAELSGVDMKNADLHLATIERKWKETFLGVNGSFLFSGSPDWVDDMY